MVSEQWFLGDLRKELRLTQEDVAKSSGLTQIRISQLERGTYEPTRKERTDIVRALVTRAAVRGLEILILQRE